MLKNYLSKFLLVFPFCGFFQRNNLFILTISIFFYSTKALFQEAEARAKEARALEAPFKAAQEEVERALADVKAEEDAYNGKINDATRRSEEGGVVSRNKAKAELAQLQAEDPLPLRKAKITLEAAQKRAEKARAPFAEARARAGKRPSHTVYSNI